jgi:hypothetical protein
VAGGALDQTEAFLEAEAQVRADIATHRAERGLRE